MSKALSVLLVEDNSLDGRLLLEALKPAMSAGEVVVQTVKRLAAAQQELSRYDFSCVLLDLGLPDAVGVDNVRRLREADSKAAIIVLTGLADEKVALEAMKLGAQDYLVKGEMDGKRLMKLLRQAVERHRQSRALEVSRDHALQAATHDSLTLLPNTALFLDRARMQLVQARARHEPFVLAHLEIGGIDDARGRYGPLVADELLQRLTQLMSELLGPADTLARTGAASFALLRQAAGGVEGLMGWAQLAARRVQAVTVLGDCQVAPALQVGFAECSREGETADEVLDAARLDARRRQEQGLSLDTPTSALPKPVSAEPIPAEAVRWQPWLDAETRRYLGVELIPGDATASGGVDEVLRQAATVVWQAEQWQLTGFSPGRYAFKVPSECLQVAGFGRRLAAVFSPITLAAANVLLEVHESAFKDYDAHAEEITALRTAGFCLAMDGDGSANISLVDFSRCPLDAYKLSKGFVNTLLAESLQGPVRRFATAMIGAAQALGAVVIASGVDNDDSEQALRLVGIRCMQGSCLQLPATADQLPALWQRLEGMRR